MPTPDLTPAHTALKDAEQKVDRLGSTWPTLWGEMDRFKKNPPMSWPSWCLLPMAAPASVAQTRPFEAGGDTVARMSALNAWRYTRSVYLIEPHLQQRLVQQIPDHIGIDDLTGLPEWCIAIASDHPEWPGVAAWLHLEWDANNNRPELRVLVDVGERPVPIPIYLDRGSITEAIGDYVATAMGPMGGNVRGGALNEQVAAFAEHVEPYIALAAYLARPEADIVHATKPEVKPIKPKRPKKDTDIWLVGYSE